MNFRSLSFFTCLLVVIAFTGTAREPQRLTGADISPEVWSILEMPRTPGPHPAVILLHGSFGWRPEYAPIARAFADSGFIALAINYFAETGRDTTREERNRKWSQWQTTVRNVVAYLQGLSSSTGRPIGLVGYSRGAFLAVSVASSIPSVKAVIDIFWRRRRGN